MQLEISLNKSVTQIQYNFLCVLLLTGSGAGGPMKSSRGAWHRHVWESMTQK